MTLILNHSPKVALLMSVIGASLCIVGVSTSIYLGLRSESTSPLSGKIAVFPAVYDFGTVEQNTTLSAKIHLLNGRNEFLEILSVVKSCNCSEVEVEPKLIAPGGKAEFSVSWRVGKRRGPVNETLVALCTAANDSSQPILIRLAADVSPAVICDGDSLVFNAKNPSPKKLHFKGGKGFALKLLGSGSNHGSVKTACDSETNTITIGFDPTVPGWETGDLLVTVITGCPAEPELQFSVTIQ
jgi:Protein of unknown function (DUF1573)